MDKVFLTPVEFSKVSGIGICRVRDLCNVRDFPAARNGTRYLIHCEQAIDWIMTHSPSGREPNKRLRD